MQAVPGGADFALGPGLFDKVTGEQFSAETLGLSFYNNTPGGEVSIPLFEGLAKQRLKVLHMFERVSNGERPVGKDLEQVGRKKCIEELKANRLWLDYPSFSGEQERFASDKENFIFNDTVSHFILRLAFCKTRDAKEWFVKQEARLFALRLQNLREQAIADFYKQTGNAHVKFSPGGQQQAGGSSSSSSSPRAPVRLKDLQECTPGAKIFQPGGPPGPPRYETEFYEIPWTEITPYHLAKRRVIVKKGIAYVPNSMLTTLVIDKFRNKLREDLSQAFEGLDYAMQEKRIAPFLRTLQENGQTLFFAKPTMNQLGPSESLSLANFEIMLKRSLPPCMRWAVQAQRDQKKRLKHQGKLQLRYDKKVCHEHRTSTLFCLSLVMHGGHDHEYKINEVAALWPSFSFTAVKICRPFLREAGFDLKQSLTWWRQEVTRDPEVDENKFEKNFAYDIEHAYGKKGHMKGQNAFGCASIIGFPLATAGQVHGCPFKSMDKDMLGKVLLHWDVPAGDIEDITKKSTEKHYQLACKQFFCKTHKGHSGEGIGNHPNQFFNESVNYYTGGTGGRSSSSASASANANGGGVQPMEIVS
ncbi:unnamed protein product [Amoebophrya sp. A120]|nr:unnamed protein product [Amoebophrya sp. A120]|eukprot:GSA120T00013344001.1